MKSKVVASKLIAEDDVEADDSDSEDLVMDLKDDEDNDMNDISDDDKGKPNFLFSLNALKHQFIKKFLLFIDSLVRSTPDAANLQALPNEF